jgi:hypothetical protein
MIVTRHSGEPPPLLGTGFVLIESRPDNAEVFINDKYKGTTPFQELLSEGTHSYKLGKNKYHSQQGDFTIEKDQTVELNLSLKPNFGTLIIETNPEINAEVEIEGTNYKQSTPYTIAQLLSGDYKLKLKHPKYEPYYEDFSISDEETKHLKIEMQTIYGQVEISANPDAQIIIDQQYRASEFYSSELINGIHNIEIKKDRYHTQTHKIQIEAGKTTNKTYTLEPITGSLIVKTLPPKAKVFLNGISYSTTPRIIPDLIIGQYKLELKLNGYEISEQPVEIEVDKRHSANETLIQIKTQKGNQDADEWNNALSKNTMKAFKEYFNNCNECLYKIAAKAKIDSIAYIDHIFIQQLINERYIEISNNRLRIYESNNMYGFKTEEDRIVIKAQFQDAKEFSDGLAVVKKNGKWGYINESGKLIINYKFNEAGSFYKDYAFANSKLINKQGKTISGFQNPKPSLWDNIFLEIFISESDIKDKDLIVRVLRMYSNPTIKEEEMKNVISAYYEEFKTIFEAMDRYYIYKYMDYENNVNE